MTTTYVDTSTLVKLLIIEAGSKNAESIWAGAEALTSCAITMVEARAALAAAHRAHRVTTSSHQVAKAELSALLGSVALVELTPWILDQAADLAESDALRGYDAVHLAAALDSGAAVLTSADATLCTAAGRRGLHVANPLDER